MYKLFGNKAFSIQKIKENKTNFIVYTIGIILLALYLVNVVRANTDLTKSYSLFMDELLSYDGIRNIYNSSSISDFLYNTLDANDHRYGRIFWYIPAITSYIPYLIFGDAGQIITTRLTLSLFLFASYFILIWTFIKSATFRVSALIVLLILPFTPYYVTMPKPEPIQLFMLSLFFLVIKKRSLNNLWAWFLLGLGLGTKISLLPFVIFITGYQLFILYEKNTRVKQYLKQIYKYPLYTILGLVLSATALLLGKFASYIDSTILNTAHNNNVNINFFSWADYILNNYFLFMPSIIVIIMLIILLFVLAYLVKGLLKQSLSNTIKQLDVNALLIIAALSFILPIMLFVQRLWGFYLHIGSALLFVSCISQIEILINRQKRKWILGSIFGSILIMYTFYQGQFAYKEYDKIAKRTQTKEHVLREKERSAIKSFLESKAPKQIKVIIDPGIFIIQNTRNYKLEHFWGPLSQWNKQYDYIIIYKHTDPYEAIKRVTISNVNYKRYQESLKLQKKYTKSPCSEEVCYNRIPFELEHIYVYEKITK